uniref:ATP-dependent DNA helicase n=1 Tax=Tanacetum cinerariifolium TaxID=118510 RepID=A0A6L2LSX5_TANCI|nr:DNA helicase [Tanacetum cinerariifolium]
MLAGRSVHPPIVDRTCSSLFRDLNSVNKTGQSSTDNVGHKAVGIGNNMGSRRRCSSDRRTLALSRRLLDDLINKVLMEERSYNPEELAQEVTILVSKLNAEQKKIYDLTVEAAATGRQELIYSHGGTGKTFLLKTIINTLRSQGKIVLAVASSGIALLLLPCGRTAHSSPDKLIGDKTIVLGGDFKQTLSVKKGATKPDIIASIIAESHLWKHFKVCILKENMCLLQPGNSKSEQGLARSFALWILDIGDGRIREPDVKDSQSSFWVPIPERHCILDDANGLSNLISFIYDKNTLQHPSAQELQ